MKTISWEMDLARRVVFLDLDALPVVAVSRVSINEMSLLAVQIVHFQALQLLVATLFKGIL